MQVDDLTLRRPSLDDVFLSLTNPAGAPAPPPTRLASVPSGPVTGEQVSA
jgi:hypothetical protein